MRKRPIALILLFTTVPQLGGCAVHGTVGVRPSELRPAERGAPGDPRVVGLVYEGGGRLAVDTEPPAFETHDTLYVWSGGSPHRIRRGIVDSLLVALPGRDPSELHTSDLTAAADAALGTRVVGYTPWQGREVRFDRGRAVWFAGDTLHGVVGGAPYAVASDSIRKVSVVRTNLAASVLVSAPLVYVGAFVGLFALAMATCKPGTFLCRSR